MSSTPVLTSPESLASPYVPLDKSWVIRHGYRDLIEDHPADTLSFLETVSSPANDLQDLALTLRGMRGNVESGTVYRIGQITAISMGIEFNLEPKGTLIDRNINFNPDDVNLSQRELIDKYVTSQYASAKVLNGDPEMLDDAPPKLEVTYEAMAHRRPYPNGMMWEPRYDETINAQVAAYLARLKDPSDRSFAPRQSEDFCFAYAFGYMSAEEGLEKWPELAGHESNRSKEMPKMMELARKGEIVPSKDHRVVQAVALAGFAIMRKAVVFAHPEVAHKSFPGFWPMTAETAGAG